MPYSRLLLLCFQISIFLTFNLAKAQNKVVETTFVCSYTAGVINEKSICNMVGFRTRPEAQKAVERIVSRSGLKQNFYIMECPNIDNCFAAARNGERLIVYDASFMRRVNNLTKTDWGALSILAHEIGHHLQGHTLKKGGSHPERELEADEFSGFVMYQMGSSLKEAQSAIWRMTTDQDTGSHPPRRKRISAIKTGYNKAKAMYPRLGEEVRTSDNTSAVTTNNSNHSKVKKPELSAKEVIIKEPQKVAVKTGCISGDCTNGFGVAVNRKTLEKYEGNWKKGRRAGYGIEYYSSGSKKYEGDFLGSTFHGYGTRFYKNGDKYIGRFKKGVMHDEKASYYFRNGDRLFVKYLNGKKQGRAKIIYYGGVEGTKYYVDDLEK